jgi:4-amino-4-deoxy-L-arabinose transferase-like glycosyltransferase
VKKDPNKYLLLGLAATLPLERIPSFSVAGLNLRLSMIFGIALILRAVYMLMHGKVKLKISWPILFLVGYLVYIALLGPPALSKSRALVVIGSTGYVAALAIAIGLVYQKKYLQPIINTILIVTAVICGFALFQYIGDIIGLSRSITGLQLRYQSQVFGYPRVQGTLLEPLYLSAYLLLPIVLATAKVLFEKPKRFIWYLASLFLSCYVLFLAVSRGGTVAMVVLMLTTLTAYMVIKKLRTGKIWWYIGVVILSYALSLTTFYFINKPALGTDNKNTGVGSYTNQISNLSGEGDTRGITRNYGITLFQNNPIVGVGPGQFGVYTKQQYPSDFPGYPIVNNEPVEILAESGVIGFVLIGGFFLGLALFVINQLRRAKKYSPENVTQLALLGFLTAAAVQYQSYSTLYITSLWFGVGLIMAVSGMLLRSARAKGTKLEQWFDVAMAWLRQIITQHWVLLMIIGLFGITHIYKLNSPILDTHAWRQADTLAVARNFLQESANIFYPRIDIRQTYSGITGMEFPLYNYLIFLVAKVAGLSFWIGRALSTGFGMLGIAFLYGLFRRRYNQSVANWGALFMATSGLWFYFSRNVQPDVMMVSLSVGTLYLAQLFHDSKKQYWLVASLLMLSIAMLVKLPAVFVVLPLAVILWEARKQLRAWHALLAAGLVVAPTVTWYQHSQQLSSNYGLGSYFYEPINIKTSLGQVFKLDLWKHVYVQRMPSMVVGMIGSVAAFVGLVRSLIKKDVFLLSWLVAIVAFTFLFPAKFIAHTYYSLPFVPVMAGLAAVGLVWLLGFVKNRTIKVIVSVTVVVISVGFCAWRVRPLYSIETPQYSQISSILDKFSSQSSRIATNTGNNPILMYFTLRKGFALNPEDLTIANVGILQKDHVEYLVIDKRFALPDPKPYYDYFFQKPYEDDNFVIYFVKPLEVNPVVK